MTTDCLGNPISETDPEVIRGIDDFIEGFLAYQTRAVTILGVIGDHPASCLGNAYAGFLYMFL